MRMASIAADVALAHVRDRGFGVGCLDLEGSNESVLGLDRYLVCLVPDPDADGIAYGHGPSLRDPTNRP
jgi:hypothetical protein